MCDSIRVLQPRVAGETIQHQCQTLIAFNITRSFEVFIEHRANDVA